MPKSNLRPLKVTDIEAAMGLAVSFHRESWYRDCDFSFAKVHDLIQTALVNPAFFCIVAADQQTNEAVGYMLAVVSEHYFGRDLVVSDMGLYLKPDYRDFGTAKRMVQAMELWSHAKGAKEITLGVSSGVADERIVKFYARLGYAKGFFGVHKKSR